MKLYIDNMAVARHTLIAFTRRQDRATLRSDLSGRRGFVKLMGGSQ
jgi:hypothetical protein